MSSNKYENRWFKLDNAAKIYPAAETKYNSQVFRISAYLKEDIKEEVLQEALERVIVRFPAMGVRMKKGVFWYYFEKNKETPVVFQEIDPPCQKIHQKENNGYLFRILYYKKRIAFECFHALSDGAGAMEFLKSLIYEYLSIDGKKMDVGDEIKKASSFPRKFEMQDSFDTYYDKNKTVSLKEEQAQPIGGSLREIYPKVYTGVMSVEKLKNKTKEIGCTITEFLVAVYIMSMYQENFKYGKYNKPIRICIPVNLRKIFPSETLRNFSSYVNITIPIAENLTFDEVLTEVSEQLRSGVEKEKLHAKISTNVKMERHFVLKAVPLFIKNIVLKNAKVMYGDRTNTATITNPGVVKLPKSMEEHVERFEVILKSNHIRKLDCGICSYKDELAITFSCYLEEPHIVRRFFKYFSEELDMEIDIYAN